jgi:hypothetical protein
MPFPSSYEFTWSWIEAAVPTTRLRRYFATLNLVGLGRGIVARKNEALLGLALLFVGIFLFFRVDQIPGGLIDPRFNNYVLEHDYRWLIGLDKSFWSAPFFYPAQNVIAYSDNHLGTFLFYSAFRMLGASRETAYQLWAITLFCMNYFVAWTVLRKQGLHPVGAVCAAYVFTFTLIMAAQRAHLQLAARFMVPVAFLMASRFLDSGKGKYLLWLLAACAYQIYVGIYTGYFLLLSVSAFLSVLFLFRRQWRDVRAFVGTAERTAIIRRVCGYAASSIGFVLALLPLAIPYYQAQHEIGSSPWSGVASFLPRWESYLHAGTSLVWGRFMRFGDKLSDEHTMFVGALPFFGVLAFLYLTHRRWLSGADSKIGLAMLGAVLLPAVLTLNLLGLTFYRCVWAYVPGAGGIRAVSRIMLVLIYPVAFVFGSTVTHVIVRLSRGRADGRGFPKMLFQISILGLTVVDQLSGVTGTNKQECKRRVATMEAKIVHMRANNLNRNVLWVTHNPAANNVGSPNEGLRNSAIENLDAMLAGQAIGLNVVNGYSGYQPKNYPPSVFFMSEDSWSV